MDEIKATAEKEPAVLDSKIIDGDFNGLLNTTNYLDENACSTLGTITFQNIGPKDLKVDTVAGHSSMPSRSISA